MQRTSRCSSSRQPPGYQQGWKKLDPTHASRSDKMGKLRSRDGCLTCRRRHVKCDEAKPICGQCVRANRGCLQDGQAADLRIKRYRPRQSSLQGSAAEPSRATRTQHSQTRRLSVPLLPVAASSTTEGLQTHGSTAYIPLLGSGLSPIPTASPPDIPLAATSPNAVSPSSLHSSHLLQHASPQHPGTDASPPHSLTGEIALSRREAFLLHHFAEHLGRWLDCTDASRQFTLKMTTLVKTSPILLHSVISFAARHVGDSDAADQAHQKCIELLIPLLSSETVADDEAILCAIVILRVCEQLSVTVTGSDQERHLAGFNALLKTSQGRQVDPSIPTLSQAAFWVYVRQCLYNACVNQQPPNVDFDVSMLPPPIADGLAIDVKTETAWANTMTWICATVVHFCFSTSLMIPDPLHRMGRWEELAKSVETWHATKPSTFDPIWYRDPMPGAESPFPEIWFTADWHVMAFGFYHLACMLLAIYKPSPRFAVRSIRRVLPETDKSVMAHAHALCGACKSSPSTVPSLITLCHSTFIWAPLMMEDSERHCVIEMLQDLEKRHAWPTAWIISALREEWSA